MKPNKVHYAPIIAGLAILLVLVGGILVLLVRVQRNEEADIKQVNAAIMAAQKAEYRICLRQMINRAVIDSDKANDERRLPLYDCTPNLHGKPARRFSTEEAANFIQRADSTPEDKLP